MMTVSIIGLIINLVGLCFFHEHAHMGEEEHDTEIHETSNKKKKKSHIHEEESRLIDLSTDLSIDKKNESSN